MLQLLLTHTPGLLQYSSCVAQCRFSQVTYEHECHDPGHRFFFSQKFDLINLLPRLGHSSLLNVSCAQILPRLGHSSLLNVSCAQILHKLSKTAQTSNTAAIEQRTRGAENTKRHKRATRHNWATRHKLSNTGAIEQRTRGAENARFSGLWRLRSYVNQSLWQPSVFQ